MPLPFKQLYSRYHNYLLTALAVYKQRPDLKKYLELFLSLGAVSVFSFFAIKPTAVTIIGLTKEIKTKEATIKTMNTKIENLKQAQNVYFQQQAGLELLNLALPDGPSPETFASQIAAVSQLNSVTPGGISFSEAVLKGKDNLKRSKEEKAGLPNKVLTTTVSFNGKGQYEAIKNFISNLENLRRLFKIDSVSISQKKSTQEDSAGGALLLTLTGRLPYFGQEEK